MDDILEGPRAGRRQPESAWQVAARVEDVLDGASAQGRSARKELARRWRHVDRVGRDNAFLMAFGALAVGVLVG